MTSETASIMPSTTREWTVGSAGTGRGKGVGGRLLPRRRKASKFADTSPWTIYLCSGTLSHTYPLEPLNIIYTGHVNLGAMTEVRLGLQEPTPPAPIEVWALNWDRFLDNVVEDAQLGECVVTLPFLRRPRSTIKAQTAELKDLPVYATDSITERKSRELHLLAQRVSVVFETASDEQFEDGMESNFSRALDSLIQMYGCAAVSALENIVVSEHANAEVVGEALRWMGAVRHEQSRRYRRTVLERSLQSSSVRTRYAAGLGLAQMDDLGAIPALVKAIEHEQHEKVRTHLQLVLDQLQQTRLCHVY